MSGFICATGTEAGGGDTIQDIRLVGGEQDNNLKTPLVLFVATRPPPCFVKWRWTKGSLQCLQLKDEMNKHVNPEFSWSRAVSAF